MNNVTIFKRVNNIFSTAAGDRDRPATTRRAVPVLPRPARWLILLAALAASAVPGTAGSLAAPQARTAWPAVSLTPWLGGFTQPVCLTHAGDGSGRLFLVERAGLVKIIQNGQVAGTPFLDIRTRVLSTGGEQGLLSIAFPPGFPASGVFYVCYTAKTDGRSILSRFSLSADPAVADPASEEVLLTVAQPFANHNGGQLAFSPRDGFLYLGLGDGGSGGDPQNNAQNPLSLLGKILRLDVDSGQTPYAIPPDNPFVGNPAWRPEIWASGLRNPWRFSFDRLTGDLYIGDVGQNLWEEIDFQPANGTGGENYGWRVMEGFHCYNPAICDPAGFTLPVHEYSHAEGCSVTGGFVYRGRQFSDLYGIYLYGDYCNGMIRGLEQGLAGWENGLLLDSALNITGFGEDEDGELYVLGYNGSIYTLGATACHDAEVLADGTPVSGNLAGSGNDLTGYPLPGWEAGGDDWTGRLELATPAAVQFRLTGGASGSGPDLYLLKNCGDAASAIGYGDEEMVFGRLEPGQYFVVVDSRLPPGTSIPFGIEITAGPPMEYGDLNLDGRVDGADLVLLRNYLADNLPLPTSGAEAADLLHDGSLSSSDLVILLQYLAGGLNRLPWWDGY